MAASPLASLSENRWAKIVGRKSLGRTSVLPTSEHREANSYVEERRTIVVYCKFDDSHRFARNLRNSSFAKRNESNHQEQDLTASAQLSCKRLVVVHRSKPSAPSLLTLALIIISPYFSV